ncbi:MAG: HNH endonuclease [Lentisphaerae bacterium]|nr:HNH endonuclease [Lentisphaerota bacterium]MCP4099920.1 HNH endonuclease [Lentisphaerota bacterium]
MDDWIDIQRDEKHINRERKKAREMRKIEWWRQKLQAGICHYCGKKFPAGELTMDHVVPVARGGRSNKGNIVACCKECNNDKKYLTPAEMLMKRLEQEEK